MKPRNILFLLVALVATWSCQSVKPPIADEPQEVKVFAQPGAIRFEIRIDTIDTQSRDIAVSCTLFNDNPDTVYFLSYSCDGLASFITYDSSVFEQTFSIACNASYPQKTKIAPKGKYEFDVYMRCIRNVDSLRLGFDFIALNKDIDLSLDGDAWKSVIYNLLSHHHVIWAPAQKFADGACIETK